MDRTSDIQSIITTVLAHYPATQAIYLFGSWGTTDEWPESDADIAVLLPPIEAKRAGFMSMGDARPALEQLLSRDVDLINLREALTVLKKEIVMADRRVFSSDDIAADEFELRVLADYQKLNEERADVLAEGLVSGRFYDI